MFGMIVHPLPHRIFPVKDDGTIQTGHGIFWPLPTGQRRPMIFCVRDKDKIYWEGLAAPRFFEVLEIPLGNGTTTDWKVNGPSQATSTSPNNKPPQNQTEHAER